MPEMSQHFATALKSYLERFSIKSATLEREANVPASTVSKLMSGVRPSVERITEILAAMPNEEAAELLRAYLLDDVPPDWREAVTIIVQSIVTDGRLQSPVGTESVDSLTDAIMRLRKAADGDLSLSQWLIDTARLLT